MGLAPLTLAAPCWPERNLRRSQDAAESFIEMLHRVRGVIGADVYDRVFVVGGFFQHVCGNSEPVSAV